MEKHVSGSVSPDAAREQLRGARRAHDASVRRAMNPAGLIIALSFFCGALTLAPTHKEPGNVLTIVAVVWLIAELSRMSARNQWRPLRSFPRPKWNAIELALICLAVLVGGLIGPHLLASPSNSALTSWAHGVGVMVTVAALLIVANSSYRRRSFRAWAR